MTTLDPHDGWRDPRRMHSEDPPHMAPVAIPPRSKAIEDAIAFGIDVSLLEENLRKTPDERLRELVRMQELFELLHPDHRPKPA